MLEIIGEATRQLEDSSPEIGSLLVETRGMVGLRNAISHQYGDLDDAIIPRVCQQRIPVLHKEVVSYLTDSPPSG
jgi:uncharacterized protein with HEPN domain